MLAWREWPTNKRGSRGRSGGVVRRGAELKQFTVHHSIRYVPLQDIQEVQSDCDNLRLHHVPILCKFAIWHTSNRHRVILSSLRHGVHIAYRLHIEFHSTACTRGRQIDEPASGYHIQELFAR